MIRKSCGLMGAASICTTTSSADGADGTGNVCTCSTEEGEGEVCEKVKAEASGSPSPPAPEVMMSDHKLQLGRVSKGESAQYEGKGWTVRRFRARSAKGTSNSNTPVLKLHAQHEMNGGNHANK